MKIEKVKSSKINSVDFDNINFGSVFTDHMFECSFKNGSWVNPEIKPYQPIMMDPSARALHYGQACFEGMKAFKDDSNCTWLFRPLENYKRLVSSSKRLAMPVLPEETFINGLMKLIDLEKNWIKTGLGNSLYIRPFIFADQPSINANEADQYKFMIICAPAKSYYSGEIKVKIEKSFSRAAKGGVGYAKAAGNYAAQFYPTLLAKEEGYQQIIWTDSSKHEYIEEAGTMNLFFRFGNKLVTPPVSDSILDGITRKSLIEIAIKHNMDVEVRPIKVEEILAGSSSRDLKEIFGCGTAVVVLPIQGFGFGDKYHELPKIEYSFARKLKQKLNDIQYNLSEDPFRWRVKV